MKRERVAIAMSGGVDSSVAAALLLEEGYDVVGLTMQIWPRDQEQDACPGVRACCGVDAVTDARRVAHTLGIPHYVINLRDAFQQLVIDEFCAEYIRGRTPNPCIRCNTYVKFGDLLQRAREIDAEKLATGHYARVAFYEAHQRWAIWRAVDRTKDQSYALYDLRQEQLARALFPLGEMRKTQTRAKAREIGLIVSEKPESQQICFVAERSYRDYLARSRPEVSQPGPIVDRDGRQIGRHKGIAFYTVGQRHGLRIAHRSPLYVTGIDAEHNRLTVGGEEDLDSRGLLMRDVNFMSIAALPDEGLALRAKIRYGASLVSCTAWNEYDGVALRFSRPQRAVAPGQAAVCYAGDAVALGGIIDVGRYEAAQSSKELRRV